MVFDLVWQREPRGSIPARAGEAARDGVDGPGILGWVHPRPCGGSP